MATTSVEDAMSTLAHSHSPSHVRGVNGRLAQRTGVVGGFRGEGGEGEEVLGGESLSFVFFVFLRSCDGI
jgi:hypothetical protein